VAADRLRETGGPARQILRLGEELERVPRGNVDLDALGIVSHDAAPLGFRVPLRFRPGPRAVVTADSTLTRRSRSAASAAVAEPQSTAQLPAPDHDAFPPWLRFPRGDAGPPG